MIFKWEAFLFADSGSSFNFLLVKVHNLSESVLAQFRSLFDFLLVKPSQQWPVWLLNAVAVALILVTRVSDLSQGRFDMIFFDYISFIYKCIYFP